MPVQLVDSVLLLRSWLQLTSLPAIVDPNPLQPLLASLFVPGGAFPNDDPNRIYAGHFPQGFDPTYGPGMVLRVGSGTTAGTGGGASHPELPITRPRVQMSVFCQPQQFFLARQVYLAAKVWIHRRNNLDLGLDSNGNPIGFVISCLEQVEGQDIDDPQTKFATNISFWSLMHREEVSS